jgi:hypothetical protein
MKRYLTAFSFIACSNSFINVFAFYAITGNSMGYILYVNGEKTIIFDQGNPAWNVDTNIQFGAQNGSYNYEWFLDDMRLYPFILTDNQIMQIHKGG